MADEHHEGEEPEPQDERRDLDRAARVHRQEALRRVSLLWLVAELME
jgi:hypothetical protein